MRKGIRKLIFISSGNQGPMVDQGLRQSLIKSNGQCTIGFNQRESVNPVV